MSNLYEVTLFQKEKRNITADSAAEAVEKAMKEVETTKLPFTPGQWTVKEKEEAE